MEQVKETLGSLLRRYRVSQHLTRPRLAHLSKVNEATIKDWEDNERAPGLIKYLMVAKVLGIPLEEIAAIVDREDTWEQNANT